MSRYTLKEAAAAVQASKRTLERAVKAGELPGRKEAVAGRDLWMVDGADLAAWAEATNRRMTLPQAATPPPHSATGAAVPVPDMTLTTVDTPAAMPDTATTSPPRDATGGVTQDATLHARIRELEQERDFLRTMLDQALRALPAHPPETRRPWWRRMFGKLE